MNEEYLVAVPVLCPDDTDEDGNPVWSVEIQTFGGWSVVAQVWGSTADEACRRAEAVRIALAHPPAQAPTEQRQSEPVAKMREAAIAHTELIRRMEAYNMFKPSIDAVRDWARNGVLPSTLPQEQRQEAATEGEVGWLIEHEDEPKWLTLRPGEAVSEVCWTKESLEALRFCRRSDAEDYVSAHFGGEGPIRITEHGWG